MRELVLATASVLMRRLGYVLIVVILIELPGEILIQSAGASASRSLGGEVLTLAASVTMVLVLLRALQSRSLPLTSIVPGVLGATLRTIAAALILAIPLGVGVIVAASLILSFAPSTTAVTAIDVLTVVVSVLAAPFSLVVPVCLNENGGPVWALRRAWAISRPRRMQMWILLGGLTLLTYASAWLVSGDASAQPSADLIGVSIGAALLVAVLSAGLLAVFYQALTAQDPPTAAGG
jgi:hypothetical protein